LHTQGPTLCRRRARLVRTSGAQQSADLRCVIGWRLQIIFSLSWMRAYCMYAHRMTAHRQNPPADSSVHCGRCGIALAAVPTPYYEEKIRGWRLVWRATVVFLLPMGGAILGARAMSEWPASQLAGALIGFGIAAAIAKLFTNVLKT
jgi:hypothetical protein